MIFPPYRNIGRTILLVTALLIALVPFSRALADSINEGAFAVDSKPLGKSYEDWTIKWWEWLLSIPSETNPGLDKTGQYCGLGQGNLSVFFLAAGGGGVVERTCDVPSDKAILVPVNTVECSLLEFPAAKTDADLQKCAEEDESSNPGLFLSVDGREFKDLAKYRIPSRAFDINFSQNNIFGVSGPTRAVSDGYWIILEPLKPGIHEIHFKSSLTNPTTGILFFNDDVNYKLNVK
jgi:hypothetical protein